MRKRIITAILAIAATLCYMILLLGSSAAAQTGYTLKYPTQEEIRAKYKAYGIDTSSSVTYTTEYSLTAPYEMGDISDYDRQNGLNAINFCRYIAGLPADIELNESFNEYAQASSLVNAANDFLTHYPERPAGMSDALFDLAATGSSSSNIASGYNNIADAVIRGYMFDTDSSNIDRVGHRRWILNPDLKYTGLGGVGRYSAMYVFDWSRQETFTGDYIAWPPPNMPYEIYDIGWYRIDYAFSVTLGKAYDTPLPTEVTVDITSAERNQSWHLDQTSTSFAEYLTVENSNYGMPKCIIFNVGMFSANDTVTVTVNGITKNGVPAPITYTVNFFEIEHHYKSEVTQSATCTTEGVTTYTCYVCGDSYNEPIAKTEHSYSSEWTTDSNATCIAEGSKSHHCVYCGEKKDITSIPLTDHTYFSEVTKAATCTELGIETLTCSVCNATTSQSIALTDHSFGEYKITVFPTSEAEGVEERTCSNCGIAEQRPVAKLTDASEGTSSEADDEENESSIDGQENTSVTVSQEDASSTNGGESMIPSSGASEENDRTDAPAESAPADESDGGFPVAAGIAIAVCVPILCCGLIIFLILARRKKKAANQQ